MTVPFLSPANALMADCRTVTAAARLVAGRTRRRAGQGRGRWRVALGTDMVGDGAHANLDRPRLRYDSGYRRRRGDRARRRARDTGGNRELGILDEVSGDRTVDDAQDLAQHQALGSKQEGQRLGKVSTDHQMGSFRRTGSTRCTALSALDHPICTTRRAEAASFAGKSQQMLVSAALHLTGRRAFSSRAEEL